MRHSSETLCWGHAGGKNIGIIGVLLTYDIGAYGKHSRMEYAYGTAVEFVEAKAAAAANLSR